MKIKPPRQEWSCSSHRESIGKALSSPKRSYQPLQQVVPGDRRDRLAAKKLSPGDPIQPTVAENAFVQVINDVQEDFYTRFGAHDGTPPIWQRSIFSDPAYLSFKSQVHIIA
ncbi:hypothetical protein [Absidia glauca]|uniref:Ndc10 domain-containing protein n=1 Tax=Absidia glauca TaxID=4829 RepID=A0A168P2J1_ABSGL|nr:hypothetical protein [Absidia glauca]